MQDITYKYYHKRGAETVFVVLHGSGLVGIETPFITQIIEGLVQTGQSVFGFNFPYCDRGEESSSGQELAEEVAALDDTITFLRQEGYKKIIIVAKSMGGIVASFWLAQSPAADIRIAILGYVLGSVNTEALRDNLTLVIQGEHDRFGDAAAVQDELSKFSIDATVIEITGADHSYRNEQQESVFQSEAIGQLIHALEQSDTTLSLTQSYA